MIKRIACLLEIILLVIAVLISTALAYEASAHLQVLALLFLPLSLGIYFGISVSRFLRRFKPT